MPISAAGNKRRESERGGERGFTLIELMVVVTIIGLASAAVVFALPDPRGRLADEAAQFAARASAARDLAVIDAKPISVWVSDGGYGFDERVGGDWTALAEKPLRVTHWRKGTHAIPTSGSRDRVLFDSVGGADRPLEVTLERDGQRQVVHIGNDGRVRVGG